MVNMNPEAATSTHLVVEGGRALGTIATAEDLKPGDLVTVGPADFIVVRVGGAFAIVRPAGVLAERRRQMFHE